MIEESIKTWLTQKDGAYKFKDLVTYLEETGINYYHKSLRGPVAISSFEGVWIDIDRVDTYPDMVIFFIMLHETCHMKRILKNGQQWAIEQLSIEDKPTFLKELFAEEVLADRFACRMFYKLNNIIYPWSMTQQLDRLSKQKAYAPLADNYFGKINNDEVTYRNLLQKFIIKND